MESATSHPTPAAVPAERDDLPKPDPTTQEIRLAMAMNGGVSLAVWMGGCAVELDCARRAHWGEDEFPDAAGHSRRTVYASLCRAFRRELVIDIMSGASAGGVNGGLLAGAMFFNRRLDPDYVRQQWLGLGDFSSLLHAASDPAPRSLLQGAHFIQSLLAVFEDLAADDAHARGKGLAIPPGQAEQASRSLPQLDITVTDVRGTERTYRDKWNGLFAAREYRRRFRFRKEADFTAQNLAVAARCSASFPAAFEPYRPNAASWALTDQPTLAPSGEGPPWTIDGGLLDNAPIRAAIELIPTRAARSQVSRFLVYVNPEPHESLEPGAAGLGTNANGLTPSDEPELAQVAGYVVNLPRKLPFVDQLDAIEDAVQKSQLVADGALDLLAAPIDTVEGAARALLPTYTSRRQLKSLRELLGDPAAAQRAYDTLHRAGEELPWIPPLATVFADPVPWEWGLSAAMRICHFLLDLIGKAILKARADLKQLLDARIKLDQPLAILQAALDGSQENEQVLGDLRSEGSTLTPEQRIAALQGLAGDQSGALPAVRRAMCIFRDLLEALGGELTLPRENRADVEVGAALFGDGGWDDAAFRAVCEEGPLRTTDGALTDPERRCLRRLLSTEVIRRAYTAEEPVDSAQKLNFVQLTPDAPSPIFSSDPLKAPFPASPENKLTGIRLGHFAGFLKRSWRANDFMWGRLDAAARIVDLLVDPGGTRDLDCDKVACELAKSLIGDDATLEQRWLVAEVLREEAGGCDPPEALELRERLSARIAEDLMDERGQANFTRLVCTRAAQLEIVRTELPAIADASVKDAADGSATKPIDFGQVQTPTGELPQGVLRDAITNVRNGKRLPVRLGRDDPAETTSDLTARMGARAGFVTLAALRTAKLPAARALDFLRPPLLAVTGMSARGWLLRAAVVLGFWAAAIYLAARIVGTNPVLPADLGELAVNELLIALATLLAVVGVAILPLVRGLRRKWAPVAIAEFVAAFLILAFGGGAAIVTAIAFGDLSPAQLIVANGFDEPPDWFLDVALAVIFGLPLAAPAYLPWAATWASDISKHVTGAALLLAAVSIAMGIWLGLDLGDVLDGGSWQSVTGWIALIGPPLVGVPYLFVFHRARGAAPAGAER